MLSRRLRQKSAKVYVNGSKSWEDRPLPQVIFKALQKEWEKLDSVAPSVRQWISEKFSLEEKRGTVFRKLEEHLDFSYLPQKGLDWLVKNLNINPELTSLQILKAKTNIQSEKLKHLVINQVDRWMTINAQTKSLTKLDHSFLDLLFEKKMIKKSYPIQYQRSYGLVSASAYHGAYLPVQKVLMDVSSKKFFSHNRFFVLAHEVGHLESQNHSVHFNSSRLNQDENKLIENTLLNPNLPFYKNFEEVVADMFATACILKISNSSTKGLSIIENQKNIAQTYYDRAVEKNVTLADWGDVELSLGDKILFTSLIEYPHLNCVDGIEQVLKYQKEVLNISNEELFSFVLQKASDLTLDLWTQRVFNLKNENKDVQGNISSIINFLLDRFSISKEPTPSQSDENLRGVFYHFLISTLDENSSWNDEITSKESVIHYLKDYYKISSFKIDWITKNQHHLISSMKQAFEKMPKSYRDCQKNLKLIEPDRYNSFFVAKNYDHFKVLMDPLLDDMVQDFKTKHGMEFNVFSNDQSIDEVKKCKQLIEKIKLQSTLSLSTIPNQIQSRRKIQLPAQKMNERLNAQNKT